MSNFFGITDTGKMRENNEDAFIAEKVLKDRYIMACVIDGVGGYEGGEIAAHIAKENILSYFSILSGDVTTMMKEALIVANEKIYEERLKSNDNKSMACVLTMAVADTQSNKFYYAHIGDTRLYLFRDNSLVKITKDHSFVGFLEDTGRLTEEEAMKHPKRNEINKALGFDPQMRASADYIETGESPFLPGDVLLLCSDGLSDLVNVKEITSVLLNNKSLEEKARALIEAANNYGGKDNITVALVEHDAKPVKQKATKPVIVKKSAPQTKQPVSEITPVAPPPPEERSRSSYVQPQRTKSNNKGLVIFLIILCFILLCLALWPWLRIKRQPQNEIPTVPHGAMEKKIADTIHRMIRDSLQLAVVSPRPITLTDTLIVDRDSLTIIGNGQVGFKADSSFKGPAIVVSPACDYVLLQDLTFENFDIAVMSNGRGLHLKNVRFKNCGAGVMQGFSFLDNSYVNGSVTDTSFFKTDSLTR